MLTLVVDSSSELLIFLCFWHFPCHNHLLGDRQARLSLRSRQPPPSHPQVGPRKKRQHVRVVLSQALEAQTAQLELLLDDPERVLHPRTDLSLQVFQLQAGLLVLVLAVGQCPDPAAPFGDTPRHRRTGRFGPFMHAGIAGIAVRLLFVAVQQCVRPADVGPK